MSSAAAFNSPAVSCSSSSEGKSFEFGDSNSWVRTGASCVAPQLFANGTELHVNSPGGETPQNYAI